MNQVEEALQDLSAAIAQVSPKAKLRIELDIRTYDQFVDYVKNKCRYGESDLDDSRAKELTIYTALGKVRVEHE